MKRNIFLGSLLLLSVLGGCSKSEGTKQGDQGVKEEEIIEKDITADAMMTVNIENKAGATAVEGSTKLVDDNPLSKFLIEDIKDGLSVQFKFQQAVQIASYKITAGNDADTRDPMDWKILGSNDGNNWVTLDRQDYEMFGKRSGTKRYYFKNNKKYSYYKWEISKLYVGKMFQAAEFRLVQMPEKQQVIDPITFIDTIDKEGLRLLFVNKAKGFSPAVKKDMIDVFFTNYPKLLRDFNPNAQKIVPFRLTPDYDGVAFVFGGMVTFGSDYMAKNPNDVDVVTHEIMHLVQSYSGGTGWITEGIADYVRFKYGLHNDRANWTLPPYGPDQKYTDAYRVTARFLVWIEKNYGSDFVKKLDSTLRKGTYTDNYWKEETGKTVDELWSAYQLNPTI